MKLVCLLSLSGMRSAPSPQIWLAPLQPITRPDGSLGGVSDYFNLFKPHTWDETAKSVRVFKIYPELVRDATDAQLRALFTGVAANHLELALETPVLITGTFCGARQNPKRWMVDLVSKLRRLGGNLQIIVMVGPLVDGYTSTRQSACRPSITDVANEAANTIAAIRRFYPSIKIGEIEPVGSGPGYPNWAELPNWLVAVQKSLGVPLSFFHSDVEWGHTWGDSLESIAVAVRAAHVRFGVIYNGTPEDLSDLSVSNDTLLHSSQVETAVGIPDDIVFQSWQNFPRRALPDDDPSTMTGTVRAYLAPAAHIAIEDRKTARLTFEDDRPVRDVKIVEERHKRGPLPTFEQRRLGGIAPHEARSALVGIRIHSECTCAGNAIQLDLKDILFRQPRVSSLPGTTGSDGTATAVRGLMSRYDAGRGDPVVSNGQVFSVRGDDPFTLSFNWNIPPSGENAGSLVLIFFGRSGKEIARTAAPFETSWEVVRVSTPDANGRFHICGEQGPNELERLRLSSLNVARSTSTQVSC